MREILRRKVNEDFWKRKIACWETKRQYDPSLVWDGGFRWFQSANVMRLEDYRNPSEMQRIRENILKPARWRASYRAA